MDHGTKSLKSIPEPGRGTKNSQSTVITDSFVFRNENVEKKDCLSLTIPASLPRLRQCSDHPHTACWIAMKLCILLVHFCFLLQLCMQTCYSYTYLWAWEQIVHPLRFFFTQQYQNQTNFEVTNRLPSAPIDSHKPISSGNKLRNFYNWLFVGYPIHEMVSILIFRIVIICWHLLLMCSYLHCDSKWFIFSDWKDAPDSVQDVRALMAVGQTLSQCYK